MSISVFVLPIVAILITLTTQYGYTGDHRLTKAAFFSMFATSILSAFFCKNKLDAKIRYIPHTAIELNNKNLAAIFSSLTIAMVIVLDNSWFDDVRIHYLIAPFTSTIICRTMFGLMNFAKTDLWDNFSLGGKSIVLGIGLMVFSGFNIHNGASLTHSYQSTMNIFPWLTGEPFTDTFNFVLSLLLIGFAFVYHPKE